MRVVIIGGTGNLGTHTLRSLAEDAAVDSLVGVARRFPGMEVEKTVWASADVRKSGRVPLLRGADAAVQLAWLFQPTHGPQTTWEANALGSARVLAAAA